MKGICSILLIAALMVAVPAFADTMYVGSGIGSSETSAQWNSTGNPNIYVSHPTWGSSYNFCIGGDCGWSFPWVSFAWTGSYYGHEWQYVAVPIGDSVTFYNAFTIPGTPTAATLQVMAADTAEVKLNGVLIRAADTSFGQTEYFGCGDTFGCRSNTELNVQVPAGVLHSGVNLLEIKVIKGMEFALSGQRTGFGQDHKLTITYTPATCTTP